MGTRLTRITKELSSRDPDKALSDGPNAWPLGKMGALLETLVELDRIGKRDGFLESV